MKKNLFLIGALLFATAFNASLALASDTLDERAILLRIEDGHLQTEKNPLRASVKTPDGNTVVFEVKGTYKNPALIRTYSVSYAGKTTVLRIDKLYPDSDSMALPAFGWGGHSGWEEGTGCLQRAKEKISVSCFVDGGTLFFRLPLGQKGFF